jgi:hypothetical protein
MATEKQRTAAKRNVKKAQAGAKRKQTLMNLPSETRSAPGEEAASARRGDASHRDELLQEARRLRHSRVLEDRKKGSSSAPPPPQMAPEPLYRIGT